jgi:hypothetical protein
MTLREQLNQILRDRVGPVVDWRATFQEFNRIHGGEPVTVDGQLLYEDCWRWSSAVSHMGRAIPPPSDVARLLAEKRCYWSVRRETLMKQIMHVERCRADAAKLQLTVNHPLIFGNGYEEGWLENLQDLVANAEEELMNLTTDTEDQHDRDRATQTPAAQADHADAGGDADIRVQQA